MTERRRGAGPRSAILALLDGVARPLASGAELDVSELRVRRWPSAWWRIMAASGWRRRWRNDTVKSGQAWCVRLCGGCPTRQTLAGWRRLWARLPIEGRLVTAHEWAARTGETLPDWLR